MNKETAATIRKKIPPLGKKQELILKEPQKIYLDNGIKVYIIDGGDWNVTRLDMVFEAGTAYQNKKLTANSVNKLISEGTASYSSFEISELLDYYGAFFDPFVNKDSAGITLYALSKYYGKLLPLMFEMVTEATFPQHEIDIYLEREYHSFKVNLEKVRYRAMLEFNRLMFGKNSAYGQTLQENDFLKITRNDLIDFYKNRYSLNNGYFILSGTANGKIIKLLNSVFGQHKPSNGIKETNPEKFVTNCKEKNLLIEKENSLQSAILFGYPAIDKTDRHYSTLTLLNTVLGGYFGSRLMTSLREEKGLTYGIHSFVKNYKHGNYLAVSTEVNANQTREAVQEIKRQIDLLKTEKIDKHELQLVKNYLYGTFLRGFDGPFALSDRLKNVIDFNLNMDFYKKHLNNIMNVKAEDIRKFAEIFFDNTKQKLLIVGKTAGLK